MTELLTQLSAFSVFLAIAAVGFLFLLISFVFGEVFSHFDFSGDHDVDHGMEHDGPSFFSPRIISVFVTAFGGSGAVAIHLGLHIVAASLVGFASGFVFAWIIYVFARFLYSQQATTTVRSSDMVGQNVRVIVAIPSNGVGQVRCRVGDELIDKIARSSDGKAIPENTVVRVAETLGEVVVVHRASTPA